MAYFPMCVDLTGRPVLLVGSGPQIRDKAQKLRPFGCALRYVEKLGEEMLTPRPAMVIVGDVCEERAAQYAHLCAEKNIPVNVVDKPALCSFAFPALTVDGDLTVAVSTGGKSPAASACIARMLRQHLPSQAGEIVGWLSGLRERMSFAQRRRAAEAALTQNRPLTAGELSRLEAD